MISFEEEARTANAVRLVEPPPGFDCMFHFLHVVLSGDQWERLPANKLDYVVGSFNAWLLALHGQYIRWDQVSKSYKLDVINCMEEWDDVAVVADPDHWHLFVDRWTTPPFGR